MNGLQTDLYLIRREEEYKKLRDELETERMRLAACGAAALGYFNGCADEYRSASLDDVLRLRQQLAECERERDELKANADRYELLRERKLFEMMEYRCLPVPIEDADDWFDAQTDAKIRERYPRATIGADKTGEGS